MNYNITTYIGQTARRHSVYIEHSITRSKKLVCSVIEKLEDDMFDFDEEPFYKETEIDTVSGYKVCLVRDNLILTEEFISEPQSNFVIGGEKIELIAQSLVWEPVFSQSMIVNMDDLKAHELNAVLPRRNCSAFVNSLIDGSRSMQTFLNDNPNLITKIEELTSGLTDLGLSMTPQHWGNVYFVTYNPIFRNVDFMLSSSPYGILLRFAYRNEKAYRSMTIIVTDFHHGDIPVSESSENVANGTRYVLVKTPSLPNCVNVRIVDEDGDMLYFRKNMHFIRSIQINTGFQSSKFVIENNGERIEVPKFVYENRKRSVDAISFENYFKVRVDEGKGHQSSSKLYNSEIFAEDKKQNSVHDFIISLLNQAKNECYICDPYFSVEEFIQTVARMDNVVTRVNILTSETYLKEEDAARMKQILSDYNKLNRNGGNVLFRLTKKRKTLHERLIIIDDKGWVYNKSFNDRTKSSLLFSEIPPMDFIKYKKIVEKTWFDGNSTIRLEDYGNN